MNYMKIDNCDLVNGIGCRVSLWVSGCGHHCPSCHNPETWNPKNGKPFTQEAEDYFFKCLDSDYIDGATYTGGDPLMSYNILEIKRLMKKQKELYPNKTIWCWSGYTYEYLLIHNKEVLQYIDVLIDGRFEIDKFNPNLKWRGSANQRVIDVQSSLATDSLVLHADNNTVDKFYPEKAFDPCEGMTAEEIKEKYTLNVCDEEI